MAGARLTTLCRPREPGTLAAMNAARVRAGLLLLSVLGALLLITGCGPHWEVVQQAVPNPFLNQGQFYIEPVHSDRVVVGEKPEAVYLADKTPEQQQSWQADKADMITHYTEALISAGEGLAFPNQPLPTSFIVRPIVDYIEPGFYAYVASHPTEVGMRVEILAPSGQLLDAITIHVAIPAGMGNAASGTRLRQAATQLGHITADYIHTRVAP